MAAPYNPPVKNQDFVTFIALRDASNPGQFKNDPTIAAGDFRVSKDGGAFANLATLPSVSPAGSPSVMVTLSATENNADNVMVLCVDQTVPAEWEAYSFTIVNTQ